MLCANYILFLKMDLHLVSFCFVRKVCRQFKARAAMLLISNVLLHIMDIFQESVNMQPAWNWEHLRCRVAGDVPQCHHESLHSRRSAPHL